MNILNCTTITKPKCLQKNKIKNALSFLNLNINQIIRLKDNGADDIYKELDKIVR
jgi:hypothetical protein